jgi:hypothetical protein
MSMRLPEGDMGTSLETDGSDPYPTRPRAVCVSARHGPEPTFVVGRSNVPVLIQECISYSQNGRDLRFTVTVSLKVKKIP